MEIRWAQAKVQSGGRHSPSVYNLSTSGFTFPRCHCKPLPFISQPIRTSRISRRAIVRRRTIPQCIITSLIHACRWSAVLIETHCRASSVPSTSGIRLHPTAEKEITSSRAEALHPQSHHHQRLDTIMRESYPGILHGSIFPLKNNLMGVGSPNVSSVNLMVPFKYWSLLMERDFSSRRNAAPPVACIC
jgi:hypothetical protein